jgi:hypothetical protein
MTQEQLAITALVISVTSCWWMFGRNKKQEQRRQTACQLAIVFRKEGLERTAELMECYAVGDYNGMMLMLESAQEPTSSRRIRTLLKELDQYCDYDRHQAQLYRNELHRMLE